MLSQWYRPTLEWITTMMVVVFLFFGPLLNLNSYASVQVATTPSIQKSSPNDSAKKATAPDSSSEEAEEQESVESSSDLSFFEEFLNEKQELVLISAQVAHMPHSSLGEPRNLPRVVHRPPWA